MVLCTHVCSLCPCNKYIYMQQRAAELCLDASDLDRHGCAATARIHGDAVVLMERRVARISRQPGHACAGDWVVEAATTATHADAHVPTLDGRSLLDREGLLVGGFLNAFIGLPTECLELVPAAEPAGGGHVGLPRSSVTHRCASRCATRFCVPVPVQPCCAGIHSLEPTVGITDARA